MSVKELTADQLIGALDALDVPFLMSGARGDVAQALTPTELMEGLAQSREARVRSALVPLLLRHPEFARDARTAASHLSGNDRRTLELFYTAALLLQKQYDERLRRQFGDQPSLPDLFGKDLDVGFTEDIEQSLARLGKRHAELSGLLMNWAGGYRHAALTWLEYIELHAERRRRRQWQAR